MDTIFLQSLAVDAEIGVYNFERGKRQRLLFDIELACDLGRAGTSDALGDTIDYAEVADTVIEIAEGSAFQLVEALAECVARELLFRFPIQKVRLRLHKPDAVARAESVGVAIERRRTK